MPQHTAENLVRNVGLAVVDSPEEFVRHLAALSAFFPDEVVHTTTDGRSLRQVLYTATAAGRTAILKENKEDIFP